MADDPTVTSGWGDLGAADPPPADPPAAAPAEAPADPAPADPWALRRMHLGEAEVRDRFLIPGEPSGLVVPVAVYSRTRSGPTAFGLFGRIALSLLVVGLAMALLNPLTILGLGIVVPMLLRGLWHRERIPMPLLRDQSSRPRY